MLREAELFVLAEPVLVEVIGRIRPEHRAVVIPPLFDQPGVDQPTPLRQVVERCARDDAWVPELLARRTVDDVGRDRFDGDLLGDDPHGALSRLADTACAAARRVADGEATVRAGSGDVSSRDYLLQLAIAHSFTAHDIAIHLGSRACPLTEELARGLWESTEPEGSQWRARGVFREPFPLPDHVSWRDRFLLSAGRDPHPLH